MKNKEHKEPIARKELLIERRADSKTLLMLLQINSESSDKEKSSTLVGPSLDGKRQE